MYALPNKTQHKLIVKVRGGISQKLDNFTSSQASTQNNSSGKNDSQQRSQTSLASPLTQANSFSNSASASALSRHLDEAGFGAELNYSPQPVFHSISQNGNKQKSSTYQQRAQKQYITPEHNEMIKYVQQSWKGVERDYKNSVSNYIDFDGSSASDHHNQAQLKHKQAKKKSATASTPLLLSGSSYHHISGTSDLTTTRQDSFQPFDLEAFWGNRILKRLTEEL